MRFVSWLLGRAPAETDPAPSVGLSPAHFNPPDPAKLHENDADEEHHLASFMADQRDRATPLPDVFTVIEYIDSKGTPTRRRVTMQAILPGSAAPMVQCVCHERRAARAFRVDRITSVITADGEIVAPRDWFRDTLHVDIGDPAPVPALRELRAPQPPSLAEVLRPGTMVLVAAARSDRDYHVNELDTIQQWLESEARHLHRAGRLQRHPTPEECDALAPQLAAMRPQRRSLERHVVALAEWPDEALQRLARALQRVVVADGQVVADELDFLAELRTLATEAGTDHIRDAP